MSEIGRRSSLGRLPVSVKSLTGVGSSEPPRKVSWTNGGATPVLGSIPAGRPGTVFTDTLSAENQSTRTDAEVHLIQTYLSSPPDSITFHSPTASSESSPVPSPEQRKPSPPSGSRPNTVRPSGQMRRFVQLPPSPPPSPKPLEEVSLGSQPSPLMASNPTPELDSNPTHEVASNPVPEAETILLSQSSAVKMSAKPLLSAMQGHLGIYVDDYKAIPIQTPPQKFMGAGDVEREEYVQASFVSLADSFNHLPACLKELKSQYKSDSNHPIHKYDRDSFHALMGDVLQTAVAQLTSLESPLTTVECKNIMLTALVMMADALKGAPPSDTSVKAAEPVIGKVAGQLASFHRGQAVMVDLPEGFRFIRVVDTHTGNYYQELTETDLEVMKKYGFNSSYWSLGSDSRLDLAISQVFNAERNAKIVVVLKVGMEGVFVGACAPQVVGVLVPLPDQARVRPLVKIPGNSEANTLEQQEMQKELDQIPIDESDTDELVADAKEGKKYTLDSKNGGGSQAVFLLPQRDLMLDLAKSGENETKMAQVYYETFTSAQPYHRLGLQVEYDEMAKDVRSEMSAARDDFNALQKEFKDAFDQLPALIKSRTAISQVILGFFENKDIKASKVTDSKELLGQYSIDQIKMALKDLECQKSVLKFLNKDVTDFSGTLQNAVINELAVFLSTEVTHMESGVKLAMTGVQMVSEILGMVPLLEPVAGIVSVVVDGASTAYDRLHTVQHLGLEKDGAAVQGVTLSAFHKETKLEKLTRYGKQIEENKMISLVLTGAKLIPGLGTLAEVVSLVPKLVTLGERGAALRRVDIGSLVSEA